MTRSRTLSLAFLVALAFVPSVASAASFSSISWAVTGGTFNGPNSTGPITGGSLVYTPGGGALSTPAGGFDYYGSLVLILTGPSGSFSVNAGENPFGRLRRTVNPTTAAVRGGHCEFGLAPNCQDYTLGVAHSGGLQRAVARGYWGVVGTIGYANGESFVFYLPYPYSNYPGYTPLWNHSFVVGAEVRVEVPEPSTGLLLGLGLLAPTAATRSTRTNLRWENTRTPP